VNPRFRYAAPLAITLLVAAGIAISYALSRETSRLELLRRVEWITYDWRVRSAFQQQSSATAATNLAALFIDDESLKEINNDLDFHWPWPRMLYGRVIKELAAQKAAAVGFDVFLIERQRDYAETRVREGETTFSSDDWFSRQMLAASNVILGVPGQIEANQWHAVLPATEFLASAAGLGLAVSDRDSDGVLRRARPYRDDPTFGRIWHLGIQLAARSLGLDLTNAAVRDNRIILSGAGGISRTIPLDHEGLFLIDWSLAWNDRRLTLGAFEHMLKMEQLRASGATDLEFDLDGNLAGKLIVIGSIGSGNNISDIGASPLEKETYLVSKHWNVANSVLTGRFIQRTPTALDLLIITLMSAIAALVTWRFRAPWPSLVVAALAAAYVGIAFWLFTANRWWIPIVAPVAGALIMTHVATVTYQVLFEQRERRRVRGVFSKVVSPDVVTELLRAEKLNLVGSRRHVTVFFADVRGFTEMTDVNQARAEEYVRANALTGDAAEKFFDANARETLNTVNLYLAAIADEIKKHQGTLDKYIGDCVMAFWGAPVENQQHAACCVRAAIDAQRAMHALNEQRAEENQRREAENPHRVARGEMPLPTLGLLSLGTGINTGTVIVGLMGSDSHILNYTVFGRDVNLASRLEGVSGRGRIIIGESTYHELLKSDPALAATCVELQPEKVKGFQRPVNIFEVPWRTAAASIAQAAPAKPV
jgi:adenylate cyclase